MLIMRKIKFGLVKGTQVPSKENIDDILTKGLGKHPQWVCLAKFYLSYFSTSRKPFICEVDNVDANTSASVCSSRLIVHKSGKETSF